MASRASIAKSGLTLAGLFVIAVAARVRRWLAAGLEPQWLRVVRAFAGYWRLSDSAAAIRKMASLSSRALCSCSFEQLGAISQILASTNQLLRSSGVCSSSLLAEVPRLVRVPGRSRQTCGLEKVKLLMMPS